MVGNEMTVLQKALLDSVLNEYRDVPCEKELKDTFSPRFKQWASDFLQKQTMQRIRMRSVIRTILIAAILILLLAGTVAAIPIVRKAMIGFSITERKEAMGVTFDPVAAAAAPDKIETIYTFDYVPEGFKLELDNVQVNNAALWWSNSENQRIHYSQILIPDYPTHDGWIGFGNPEDPVEQTLLGEYMVTVVWSDEDYILLWTNDEYFFKLIIPMSIPYDSMVQMFLSWRPVE